MATYKWSVKPANLISGTTLIKETDNKIQANLDDIADFINGEGEYIGQGLTFDMLDKNSSQTILGIKTFTNGIVSNVTGNLAGNVTGDITGNSETSTKLQNARTISISGAVNGTTTFDGSSNVNISTTGSIVDLTTNQSISGIKTFTNGIVSNVTGNSTTATNGVPVGAIVMWSGAISSIPTGWALCNGTNGTPNLQDRFIIGASTNYAVGTTGGSKDAIVVSHTHTQVAHNHTDSGHTHSAYADTQGAHNHTYLSPTIRSNLAGNTPSVVYNGQADYTSVSGSHSHNISIGYGSANISSVAPVINSTGSDGTNANLPPYYALAYIMKL